MTKKGNEETFKKNSSEFFNFMVQYGILFFCDKFGFSIISADILQIT